MATEGLVRNRIIGSNSHGQLGLGFKSEQETRPYNVGSIVAPISLVTGGGSHSFILGEKKILYSCGNNDRCQLGIDSTSSVGVCNFRLLHYPFPGKVTKVSCGWDFTLCLIENGKAYGWGSNSYGQLGFPVHQFKRVIEPQEINVVGCIDIGTGLRHSCLVILSGEVLCSGSNSKGRLGLGVDNNLTKVDTFTKVPYLRGIVKIACGEHFTLALSEENAVFTWGDNRFGQLGVDPQLSKYSLHPTSVTLPNIDCAIQNIFCGWSHCSLLTGNCKLISWGRADYGQLGEKRAQPWEPRYILEEYKFKQVAVGSEHSVALTETGAVVSWGWNEHGNCGNGETETVRFPHPVQLPINFKAELIGSGYAHNFACGTLMTNVIDISFTEGDGSRRGNDGELLRLSADCEYQEFFSKCLLPNEPCIISNATSEWPCLKSWVTNANEPNIDYFGEKYGSAKVTVANCDTKIYNVHEKRTTSVIDYVNYWKKRSNENGEGLYLKDWHFTKDFPDDSAYRVPKYFSSDWLNEYYDNHPQLNDDYRFVYMGPKGTWTPLHADVFTSYSWSINVVGEKRWVLLRPGVEERFRDSFGNLIFDMLLNYEAEPSCIYHVVQGPGDAIFVPSGWHHQVWNLKDTVSINHNWVNGCNIHHMWSSMQRNLNDVEKEIEDCSNMENWSDHCQVMLKALYGFNYQEFYDFLVEIIETRIAALGKARSLTVYGSWSLGVNHLLFDIKQAMKVLDQFKSEPHLKELNIIPNEFCKAVKLFLDEFKL